MAEEQEQSIKLALRMISREYLNSEKKTKNLKQLLCFKKHLARWN